MIRHVSTRREDRVADAVGCVRAFGGVFVLTGTFSLSMALFGWGGVAEAGVWPRLGLAVIGGAHLGGGLFVWSGPRSSTTVQRRGVEWVERRPFRPALRRTIEPSEVDLVRVEEQRDSDGDATFRVVLALRSGGRLPLTVQGTPSQEAADESAAAVARRLQIPDRPG